MSSNQSTSLLQLPGPSCSVDRKLSQQASNRQLTNTFVTFLHLFRKTSINHSIKYLTHFLGGMNPLIHLARLQPCFSETAKCDADKHNHHQDFPALHRITKSLELLEAEIFYVFSSSILMWPLVQACSGLCLGLWPQMIMSVLKSLTFSVTQA